jgi:hypothetical protein
MVIKIIKCNIRRLVNVPKTRKVSTWTGFHTSIFRNLKSTTEKTKIHVAIRVAQIPAMTDTIRKE